MVRAGALIGLYSTAKQYGQQAGEIARRVLGGDGALPRPEYPRYFTVGVNASVARSLNIRVEGEASLVEALSSRERVADDAAGRRPR
jgi:putative ABC transport system substrate-binding protein